MVSKTLTTKLVQSLSKKDRPYDVRDSDLKGFLIRVYPSGRKSYRCEYKRGKSITIGRSDVMTSSQARNQAKQILGEAAKGVDPKENIRLQKAQEDISKKQITFKKFIESEFSPWYRAACPKTWRDAMKNIKRNFYEYFGDKPLISITRIDVEKWCIQRSKSTRVSIIEGKRVDLPIKPATINRNIEQLNSVMNKAVRFGFIKENPISGIDKLKIEKSNRTRYLSKEELVRLMKALDDRDEEIKLRRDSANSWRKRRHQPELPDLRKVTFSDYLKPMVLLSLGSGVRFGSLVRLEWHRHVNFASKNIILKLTADIVKTSKAYEVPLDAFTSEVLRVWYHQTKSLHYGEGWVFPGKTPGQHITSVKKSWRALLKRAGIEDFRWHDQRHDFASQHVMSGTDLYTVMELLGHTDPNMTKRYAHLSHEHKIKVAENLSLYRSRMLGSTPDLNHQLND